MPQKSASSSKIASFVPTSLKSASSESASFKPRFILFSLLLGIPGLAAAAPDAAAAAKKHEITPEDYRLFCGYQDALEDPSVAKLKGAKRDAKIAKMAKLPPKKLMAAVKKAELVGSTCDEIGKLFEAAAKKAVDATLAGRIDSFDFDASDPSHVVASVVFRGGDIKKVVQEAALVAKAIGDVAPITKTLAIRVVSPTAPDRTADAAIWFEGKMNAERSANIDAARVKDFADSRYIRLFDGIRCGSEAAAETALGYARGPCQGKTL
jgi:hypothetical protein